MRVLVNALSVTNMSGRHVLLGHLAQIAEWTRGEHHFTVLYHALNKDICRALGSNVEWQECPVYTVGWAGRAAWENLRLPSIAAKAKVDFMFTPSGTVVPGLSLPQVSFAQNPWSLVSGLQKSLPQQLKAFIQRKTYKAAMKQAAMMVFNSEYMRQEYRRNAGFQERASEVVYQALDESTHLAADIARMTTRKKDFQVLCVSAMAPHKGAETLVEAIALLRNQHGIPANLVMAGPWPDAAYQNRIVALVKENNLGEAVVIRGHVSREELHQLYAESRVFSLMSHCESFGIPAVEAQAFGTPVVSSNCCAISEVCGEGGLYPEPGDAEGTAEHLANLLSDQEIWAKLSEAAIGNAGKYHWNLCSRKMLRMFEINFESHS
jgi:glycosyltransferase involved in cell wall biosynthesis